VADGVKQGKEEGAGLSDLMSKCSEILQSTAVMVMAGIAIGDH